MSKPISTLTLPAHVLAAVSPFMASNDVLFYLCGVMLEPRKGGVRAAATNGHIIGVAAQASVVWDGKPATVTLPRDLVLGILKLCKPGTNVEIRFYESGHVVAEVGSTSLTDVVVPGVFPDWKVLVSDKPMSGEPASFGVDVMTRLFKAADLVRKHGKLGKLISVQVEQNGNAAAPWSIGDLPDGLTVAGVVMPIRANVPGAFAYSNLRACRDFGGAA